MLHVHEITKQLPNGKQLLKGISFSVSKGEFVGILGPSGAGKTLTMKCLNGLLKPTTGSVKINLPNQNIVDLANINRKDLKFIRQHIGVIFQGFNLVKRLTALENVMIGKLGQINVFRSLFYGFTDHEAELAMETLKKVKMDGLAHRKVESMSGGEMQRVAIARAMYQDPIMILADEPIANLDPSNARSIMKLLKPLSENMPVIGVFHQPDIIMEYCTRVIAIKDGKFFTTATQNEF
ncbi:MAG: ATP-binding cassette domain-containing protein [Bacteroidales bacterium]|nr:ATP-binding cassette domain-containing protein [Bacteroidales bacterium]